MTVVLVDGRYSIDVDTAMPVPIPICWDHDGQPVYRRDPLVEFDIETSSEEE